MFFSENRLMTWSNSLNIYRVNRLQVFDLEEESRRNKNINRAFDIVAELLMRNMVEV